MSRQEILRAYVAAYLLKLNHLRYRPLRTASAALRAARTRQAICVWPPFQEGQDEPALLSLRRSLKHYLGESPVEVFTYSQSSRGLRESLFASPAAEVPQTRVVGRKTAFLNLRRTRCHALWRASRPLRAGSLRPHLYLLADTFEDIAAAEWLRLVSDVYRWRSGIPRRAIPTPPHPPRSCAVLGTGPSLDAFVAEGDRYDAWVGANAVACDRRMKGVGRPFALCVLDPFSFSPSESQRVLWDSIFSYLRETSAVFVTTVDCAAFIELHFPEDIREKCHYVRILGHDSCRLSTRFALRDLIVTAYGNVLTDLMLPLASTLSSNVVLYGCDGAPPGHFAEFPKSEAVRGYDPPPPVSAGGVQSEKYFQGYFHRNDLYTRYVVDECRRHGVTLRLRRPSWNRGLQHLAALG